MSSLSHSITWRLTMLAGSIGHQIVQPVLGQNEAARMLRHVPGKADQCARQVQRQAQPAVLQVEVQCSGVFLGDAFLAPAPDLGGQGAGHVLGQTHRLADVAHRAAAAIADDRGAQGGAMAAIGVVDPLDDFLAPLVLEIDVDIGRFAAFGTDETFEQQVAAGGVDRGDAQHETDRRIGGGPASLAEDALGAGEPDDAINRQEIRCIVQAADQIEFMVKLLRDLFGNAVGITRAAPSQVQFFQRLLRGQAGDVNLMRILVAEFVQTEPATIGDLLRAGDGVRDGGRTGGSFLLAIEDAVTVDRSRR